MSDYIRSKSFSHNRLNITANFFLPERSPYFLFRVRNTEPSQPHFHKRNIKLAKEHSKDQNTRLQLFKSRLINGLNNSKDMLKGSSFEEASHFRNMKLNQLLVEKEASQIVSNQFAEGSIFVEQRERKQDELRSRYLSVFRNHNKHITQVRSDEKSLKESEEPAKHSKSFMIIRKMKQMKEKIVLSKKEKFQEELYKHRETPIHHSQLFKTQKRQTEQKNKARNKNAIKDILKLRETMTQSGKEAFQKISQNRPFEVIVKGEAKFDQNLIFRRNNQSLKMSVQEYRNQKKKINLRKKATEKGPPVKREEEIGPWMKRRNEEIQLQF